MFHVSHPPLVSVTSSIAHLKVKETVSLTCTMTCLKVKEVVSVTCIITCLKVKEVVNLGYERDLSLLSFRVQNSSCFVLHVLTLSNFCVYTAPLRLAERGNTNILTSLSVLSLLLLIIFNCYYYYFIITLVFLLLL